MADYPISNVARRIVYTGSAGVGPYAFPFEVLTQTDIDVYKNGILLTLTSDYTVSISPTLGTGSITLVSAATNSDSIVIAGSRDIQRSTDFTTGGDLFANTLNDELDSQTIFSQQVAEDVSRALKAPITDPIDINMTLPSKSNRLGKLLMFDVTTGNPIAGPTGTAIEEVAENAAAIQDAKDFCELKADEADASAIAAESSATNAAGSAAAASAIIASGMYSAVQDKSADYTIVAADAGDLIRVTTTSGQRTITLPLISSVTDGFSISVVKWSNDANTVVIVKSGSDTINGATSYTLDSVYKSVTIVADYQTNSWFAAGTGVAGSNFIVNNFSGNGSSTTFTLSADPGSENNTAVFLSGVYQSKSVYAVSGTSLIFNVAPPTGTNNVEVVITQPLSIGVPSDATVSPAKLSAGGPSWDASGKLTVPNNISTTASIGVGDKSTSPDAKFHISDPTGLAVIRLERNDTDIVLNDVYGAIDFVGQDTGSSAGGIRAKINTIASGTTTQAQNGQTAIQLQTANSNSSTLTTRFSVSGSGAIVNTSLTVNQSASVGQGLSVGGDISHSNESVVSVNSITMTSADTQIDYSLATLLPPNTVGASYALVEIEAIGTYVADISNPVFANTARLFKKWVQGIVWNGTTYVLEGAVLIGTVFNSDATNFPAGAVNASKALLVASTTDVVLRLQNRTTPAGTSQTNWAYRIKVLDI